MSQVRHLWAVLMLAVEESFVAFSGVSPDLVGHSQVVRRTVRPADSSHFPAEGTTSIRGRFWLSVAERNKSDKEEVRGYGGARQLSCGKKTTGRSVWS